MGKLHIFNPEHDIALASGLSNFTAPHAGRQLRHDLGFLPALWAKEDDIILVDDPEKAEKSWRRLSARLVSLGVSDSFHRGNWQFPSGKLGVSTAGTTSLDPWGWNLALRAQLLRCGVRETLMPSVAQLQEIRLLSHRREAARLLPQLRMEGTVGEAFECQSAEEIAELERRYGQLVLKAPWSSSGRGVRFANAPIEGWLRNLFKQQGSVMAEPYYNKVKDFAMEFQSDGRGRVDYCGLSLFHTLNGAYTGNVLASEEMKREMISRYIPTGLLDDIRGKICSVLGPLYDGKYQGPFGIDMMVVASPDASGFLLHPCVEINLRRTMGHVALTISPKQEETVRVMRIRYENFNYKLSIRRL